MPSRLHRLPLVVLVLGSFACSDADPTRPVGPADPTDPTPPPAVSTPASGTLTRDGGSLQATGADGSTLRITVPEDALLDDLALTLQAVDSAAAQYRISAPSVSFLTPATLEMVIPDGIAMQGGSIVLGDGTTGVGIPTTLDIPNRRAIATLMDLRYVRGTALGAGAPLRSEDVQFLSTIVQFREISCSESLDELRRIGAEASTYYGRYDPDNPTWGIGFILEAALMRQLGHAFGQVKFSCASEPERYRETVQELQAQACSGYQNARVVGAQYDPVNGAGTPEDFFSISTLLVSWWGNILETEAACSALLPLADALAPLFDRYIADWARRLDRDGIDLSFWRGAWNLGLGGAIRLKGDAQRFDLPEASALVDAELVPRLLDLFRTGGFQRCVADQEQAYLADVLHGGGHVGKKIWNPKSGIPGDVRNYTPEQIQRDMQVCATEVHVAVFDAVAERLDDRTVTVGRGDGPGQANDRAALRIPPEGVLELTGRIGAFRCISPDTPDRWSDDALVVRLEGTEVARRTHTSGNFLHTVLDLPLVEMLDSAGLPDQPTDTLTLTLERHGEACAGRYGNPADTILTLLASIEEREGHVALRSYDVYTTAEVYFSNTAGTTTEVFVNEREVNNVTCTSASCPRTGASASASRSGSGSHEDIFASGTASGSASLAMDTTGVGSLPVLSDSTFFGAIRRVQYTGSANTQFSASGDLSRLFQRVVGTNGVTVAFTVRGAPVRYELSGSVEVGGYVELLGQAIDDIVVRVNDGPPGQVASAGILPPGSYEVRGYALQARAAADPFLTYGTGSVSFSLLFSPLEDEGEVASAARRGSGAVP